MELKTWRSPKQAPKPMRLATWRLYLQPPGADGGAGQQSLPAIGRDRESSLFQGGILEHNIDFAVRAMIMELKSLVRFS